MGNFGRIRWRRSKLLTLLLAAACVGALTLIPDMIGLERGAQPLARVPLPNITPKDLPEPVEESSDLEETPVDLSADVAVEQGLAFAEGASGEPVSSIADPRPTQASLALEADGLLPLSFDIMRPGAGTEMVDGDAIVVRKSVRVNDLAAGSLPIYIDGNSRLLVDPKELKRVLSRSGITRDVDGGSGLLTFVQLRETGIDLRYDPLSDSLLITTG